MLIQSETIRRIVRKLLIAEGARTNDATVVADHLVDANLAGHDSHGVARVARYVNDMRRGAINVKANIRVERETAGTLVVHGDWGFGQVVTAFTFDRLMERARTQGIAAAGIHHCNDTARLGAYTHAAAQAGFFALMMVNDGGWEPMIAPWGGRKALFSTNPISAAAPGPDGPAFCVDFSTSVTAVSAVRLAAMRGETLPPATLLDHAGHPTVDPMDLLGEPHGSILPLGAPAAGHKGFGLNLIIDVLCGALAGAGCSGTGTRDAQGIFAMVLNVDAFTDREAFLQHLQGLLDAIRANPTQPGTDRIRVPGESAEQMKVNRQREGIEIDAPIWEEIRTLALAHDVSCDP